MTSSHVSEQSHECGAGKHRFPGAVPPGSAEPSPRQGRGLTAWPQEMTMIICNVPGDGAWSSTVFCSLSRSIPKTKRAGPSTCLDSRRQLARVPMDTCPLCTVPGPGLRLPSSGCFSFLFVATKQKHPNAPGRPCSIFGTPRRRRYHTSRQTAFSRRIYSLIFRPDFKQSWQVALNIKQCMAIPTHPPANPDGPRAALGP